MISNTFSLNIRQTLPVNPSGLEVCLFACLEEEEAGKGAGKALIVIALYIRHRAIKILNFFSVSCGNLHL